MNEEKKKNLRWNADQNQFWGRVGNEYLKIWRPGVFIGCIVDNKDHYNTYTNNAKGIDYTLIFSFDQNPDKYGKIDYEKDELFNVLIKEISSNISDLEGYEVYEHYLMKQSEKERNFWHPLYVRKPLVDILVDTKTQEEQIERLLMENEKMLELLMKCESFFLLRDKYRVPIDKD